MHVILDDHTFKIRTEQTFMGGPEYPTKQGTLFGWVTHGGKSTQANEYEKAYCLGILGVEDRTAHDQSEVLSSFNESVTRGVDGKYEVSVAWIPGSF